MDTQVYLWHGVIMLCHPDSDFTDFFCQQGGSQDQNQNQKKEKRKRAEDLARSEVYGLCVEITVP